MEHRSEIRTDDTRAVECGIIVHERQEFAAGGFAVDVEAGRMVAYPKGEERGQCIMLQTWQGETIAHVHMTGTSRGFHGTKLYHYQTCEPYAGFYWHGKGLGAGMMLRLRRGRKA